MNREPGRPELDRILNLRPPWPVRWGMTLLAALVLAGIAVFRHLF